MATSSCHAFASAPRAAPTGAATRAITARLAFAPNRRVASPIVPRATNDAANVTAAVDIPATNDEWEAVSPVDFAADATAALNADKVVILGRLPLFTEGALNVIHVADALGPQIDSGSEV